MLSRTRMLCRFPTIIVKPFAQSKFSNTFRTHLSPLKKLPVFSNLEDIVLCLQIGLRRIMRNQNIIGTLVRMATSTLATKRDLLLFQLFNKEVFLHHYSIS